MALPLTLLVTGTGTGVGKTVLSSWLVRRLLQRGLRVRAFKPICSGGRADARTLWRAQRRALPLNVVNPWWFAEPVTPLVAARQCAVTVRLSDVCAHIENHRPSDSIIVVEGAGGLLSPLGEDFDSRTLLSALNAVPIVVAVNRLGVLNDAWLTWEALPPAGRSRAHWVLFDPVDADASSTSNRELLGERIGIERIHPLPHCPAAQLQRPNRELNARLDRLLAGLARDGDGRD